MSNDHAVYSTKSKIVHGIIWILMALLALVTIFPVLYIVLGSFKENAELLVGGSNIFPTNGYLQIISTHGDRRTLPCIR